MKKIILTFAITLLASMTALAGNFTEVPNYNTLPEVYVEKLNAVNDTHTFYVITDLNVILRTK